MRNLRTRSQSELESSFERVAKSSLEKEFEALGLGKEFELLVQQTHEEKQMKDKLIKDMAAVSKGVPDDVTLITLPDEFEVELKGVAFDIRDRLDALDQGLPRLNMCKLRENLQQLEEQIVATLIQRKEKSEATYRSFSKGSDGEDAGIILSSSPPIKPVKTPNR